MTQVIAETTSLKQIETGLQAFETRKQEIITLAESTKGLDLKDWKDRVALKEIGEKRKELKAVRVQLQKEGKSMRDLITPISKHIKSKEDELVALIEPEENRLLVIEARAEIEAEKERQAVIEQENARIQARIDKMAVYGYSIDYTDIKDMSDETFDNYLKAAQAQHEKEEAEKSEALRIQKEQEEADRLAKIAEQKRMDDERAELSALRSQQAEAQRIINEQNEKIANENKRLEDERQAIEKAKQKEIDDKRRAEEIKDAQERAAEDARIKAIEDAKESTRLEVERKEKDRTAAEKKAARQPDKVKIKKYISDIKAIIQPELKTDEAKEVMAGIQELISRFDTYATEKTESL